MKKNYLDEVLDNENISLIDRQNFENNYTMFDMGYDFDRYSKYDYSDIIKAMKKECYVIIEGVSDVCWNGYHMKDFKVLEDYKSVQEYIKNKNELLCHVWHFDFNKLIVKKIYGEYDIVDRIYPKEVDGKIISYDLYDEYWNVEFDSVEDFKEYWKNHNYKEYIKTYSSYDELLKVYR